MWTTLRCVYGDSFLTVSCVAFFLTKDNEIRTMEKIDFDLDFLLLVFVIWLSL